MRIAFERPRATPIAVSTNPHQIKNATAALVTIYPQPEQVLVNPELRSATQLRSLPGLLIWVATERMVFKEALEEKGRPKIYLIFTLDLKNIRRYDELRRWWLRRDPKGHLVLLYHRARSVPSSCLLIGMRYLEHCCFPKSRSHDLQSYG